MATDDFQIVAAGISVTPLDYLIPGAGQIQPKAITATYDGTGAASAFLPIVDIISDGGVVVARCKAPQVAAGGSADVSWFPHVAPEPEDVLTPAGVTIETLFLDTPAGSVTTATTLVSGETYLVTVQGTYSKWNLALPVGSPNANAMFPGSVVGRVSTQVGLDAECEFAHPAGPGTIGHVPIFEVNLGSGYSHVEPDGGPYTTPQPNYIYRYTLTGQGHTASFRVNDAPLADNYGKLQIVLQSFGGSGSGGGGGSLVPPAGADNSILRVASGIPAWEARPDIVEADLSLSNVVTADVSVARHGFAPKAPNDATKFLDGTGAYAVPPGGGTVDSVTAADTSIVIAGTAADPTVATGTLDVIATNHPPAAAWSNNSKKITSVADPTLAQDAATKNYVDTAAAVTSLDGITGAVSFVAGANITISDNAPVAGDITIAATPGAGGFSVVDYVEFTAPVSITHTTLATADTIVTAGGFTADGTSYYLVEFWCPTVQPSTAAANRSVTIYLFDGATALGGATTVSPFASTFSVVGYVVRRLIPSAAAHTFAAKAFVNAGTGTIGAGAGGSGNALPGYIMVTKQI